MQCVMITMQSLQLLSMTLEVRDWTEIVCLIWNRVLSHFQHCHLNWFTEPLEADLDVGKVIS